MRIDAVGQVTVSIRSECRSDLGEIRRVSTGAFGRPAEADLVDALRLQGEIGISLVAQIGKEVVGSLVLTPVTLMPSVPGLRMLGLGPVAVSPGFQRQGVGSALIGRAIKQAQTEGWHTMLVLGPPDYYMRFGFAAAYQHGIRCEFAVPEEAFMVLELQPGTLKGLRGVVRYQPEFSRL